MQRLLAIHDTWRRNGEQVQWILDNTLTVATFVVALVATGLLIHLIPIELRQGLDKWWSSTDTTTPEEIDQIHDEEELKHLGRRGPTV